MQSWLEVYVESCQISMTEIFCENNQRLKAFNYLTIQKMLRKPLIGHHIIFWDELLKTSVKNMNLYFPTISNFEAIE